MAHGKISPPETKIESVEYEHLEYTTMKKLLIIAVLITFALSTTHAQRVYKQIYDAAYKIASDPKEDVDVRKVESFKVDAVTYLNTKTLSILSEKEKTLKPNEVAHLNNQLDSMAYFMYDYVNLFTKEYGKAKNDKQRKQVVEMFRYVSMNTPLFNDPDQELVLSYYNREDYLTRFSLDTNWVLADLIVKDMLKEK